MESGFAPALRKPESWDKTGNKTEPLHNPYYVVIQAGTPAFSGKKEGGKRQKALPARIHPVFRKWN